MRPTDSGFSLINDRVISTTRKNFGDLGASWALTTALHYFLMYSSKAFPREKLRSERAILKSGRRDRSDHRREVATGVGMTTGPFDTSSGFFKMFASFISFFRTEEMQNLAYFRVNYAALVALSLAVSLLAHPFSLAALLALLAAWCFLYLLRPADAAPLNAFGRTFSDRETLGGLIAASVFVVFLTSVGGIIFSALALGAAVVCAHGAFRVPEDLFLDEVPDQGLVGNGATINLLSFINGAAGGGGRV
ncbi:unnamed protein product [Triticum turgidum subsp. durum]|uniref:PRA1 family protein n=1 Tax=Triticum turgidum subsp. durum TaxID=4567 RepID=A0A9R0SGP2_TRITD|nr:unnamed protein product [Triticum turgidum subsp. durum]